MCEHCSRLTLHSPTVKDGWDQFVEANWAPTLRSAFGNHWKQTVGSEVPAMLQISRHPGRQLNDLDSSASWKRSDPTSSAGGPSQGSAAFKALLNPQFASAGGSAGPISSQSNQQPSGSNRHNAMDEWADIFDQCKTAVNGTDVNQGSSQQEEAPAQPFINHMGGQQGPFTATTGAFDSFKSMNYAEAEECMFGESDDEGLPSSSNGSQRLPYFGAIADWPIKQMPHLPTPPRRIYRRIKRGNVAGKASAPAAAAVAASQAATTPSASQIPSPAPAVLDFDVTEARKAAAKWGQMGPQSAPLMIWPLHSGEPLQAQVIRADQVQDRKPDAEDASPPLLEESSSSSRVNTKKRSAPTTLVNTPQMLQQLAKEGSSRDSTCSSNSDDTGSQESDDSDESEPDVVSRQQHPFGVLNGLGVTADSQKGSLSQGSLATGPTPAALPRSLSPIPVTGVMTALQIRQRRQQEMAMPSTGYHVPGGAPVAHKALPPGGASMQASSCASSCDPVPVHLKHALMGKQMLDMVDGFGRAPLHVAAAAGRVDVVQQLLFGGCDYTKALQADFRELENMAHGGRPLPSNPALARPPILWAEDFVAIAGSLPLMDPQGGLKPLPESGPYVQPVSFQRATALHLASFYGHLGVTDLLLAAGACDVTAPNIQGLTALHMAAHQGHSVIVNQLCRVARVQVDALDNAGCTPLHHATALGHDGVVMELWSKSANVDLADANGWTALHHAAEGGHLDVVAKLVIAGCNVSRYDSQGMSPGHLAARHGYHQVMDKLLLAGFGLDMQGGLTALHGSVGSTALHIAAQHGHQQMVERLIEAGANVQLVDVRGYTALQCAAEGGHMGPFRNLLQAGCDPMAQDHAGVSVLHSACQGGCLEIINHLQSLGADPSDRTLQGRDCLHYAALGGACAAIDYLLTPDSEQGCSLEVTDNDGNTAWHVAAEGGHLEAVQCLLKEGASLESTNAAGCTALHIAARCGWVPLVKMLIQQKANVCSTSKSLQTPLHFAAEMGHADVVACLLDAAGKKLIVMKDQGNWTPLHHAAEQGSVDIVELLIFAGAEVNAGTDQKWTSLHLAAKEQNTGVVRVLLDNDADGALKDSYGATPLHYAVQLADLNHFNALHSAPRCIVKGPDKKGYTVLHHAVAGGNIEIVNTLLRSGHATPDTESSRNRITPLHVAAKHGRVVLLPVLMQAGYKAQAITSDGKTTLHWAALGSAVEAWPSLVGARYGSNMESAQLLLKAGADVKSRDDAGCTPMHYAAGSGDLELVELLISLGLSTQDQSRNGWDVFMWACLGGHAAVVTKLLALGSNIGVKDREERLGLHWAAEKGHADAVGVLVRDMLQANLDIQATDSKGFTALQLAAKNRHMETVAKLLDSAGTKEEKGYTALHLAVQAGNSDLVRQLLPLPACDPSAKDVDGLTALHWAASKGQLGMLAALLKRGCQVNAPTNDGWTALHEAAANGHALIVDKLLASAAQVDLKTSNGSTALHNAANCGHSAVVKQLLQAGAGVGQCALTGANALFNAATAGHTECVEVLLDAGSIVDAVTTSGSTALHSAASNGHAEVVQRLITAGTDVDVQAQNGSTALHNAAANGHAKAVEALVAAPSCDCDVQNSNGNTALHLAASKGHNDAVEALLVASADPNIRNSKSWTAVQSASANGHFEAVLRLVQHGASWRNKADCDVIKTLCRKSTFKPSYIEGRLRLAENRERQRGKGAAPAAGALTDGPPTAEERAAAEKAAEANMARLLQEEDAAKEMQERKKIKKKERKKKKKPESEADPDPELDAVRADTSEAEPGESSDEAGVQAASPQGSAQHVGPASQEPTAAAGPALAAAAAATADGTPAAKAAPKRRRGGKHRNKGLLAAEATAEAAADDGGEVEAAVQSSSDGPAEAHVPESLLPLQLERLANNGAAGASDDVAEPPKLSRRRNRGQQPDAPALALSPKASGSTAAAQAQHPIRRPQQAADAAAKQPSKAESAAAAKGGEPEGLVKQAVPTSASNAVPDKQKPAKRKGSSEYAAGQTKSGEQGQQPKQQQRQADITTRTAPAAAQGFPRSGPSHQPTPISHDTARGSDAAAQSDALPSAQQQPQQLSQQQQRHTPAAQPGTRPAPPPANPPPTRTAAASRGSARAATNYSAAVSGLVHNTAALSLRDSAEPSSAAQPNGVAASLLRAADQPFKPAVAVPAVANAVVPAANQVQSRKQQQQAQQQGRQQQQKQQQHLQQPQLGLPGADAHVSMPQFSAQQQQQQGYVHKPTGVPRGGGQYPWDMPLPPVCTPHPAAHLHIPNVDWSFHAPARAAAPGPAPGFSRTASAGNLANQNAWPQHGAAQMPPPPTHAAARQAHAASSRGDSFDSGTQRASQAVQQSQQTGHRASTSGFVVASPPGRAGQNDNRAGQTGSSVRPSAGILSVQMNTAGHSRPSGSHAQPASAMPQAGGHQAQAQAPYSGMGSSGQNMGQGVSLPSSIANNIWAVGEGNSDSQGTSAEQRPHMWASPSRNSPLRRAAEFNSHGIARQPSLSQATEIRRVAEASGLCCPITKDLMSDPVVLISDGYTYERAAITKWLERNEASPITKAPLQHKDMVPNLTMRSAIQLLIPSANSQRLFSSQLERRHV
ncbi:hypothetical protein WJX77_003070 [Trebouxia sp. C0004]